MDPALNPYSPGAGRPPAALVGRDPELRAWAVALQRIEEGRGVQPMALYGLRGVGKTVLLGRMANTAGRQRWVVAQIEAAAARSLAAALSAALYSPLTDLRTESATGRVLRALKTALSFKVSHDTSGTWNFGVDLDRVAGGAADTGSIEQDLGEVIRDVAEAVHQARGTGLALLIDEAQELTLEELTALCSAAHAAAQREWPFVLALAGLPSLPATLASAKSYAERQFDYRPIGPLPVSESIDALTRPAAAQNVTWEPEAVEYLAGAAAGYPYFIQQYGQEAWNSAPGPRITTADALMGEARGQAALDAGFFRSRWDRATAAERDYLRAIATFGDQASTGDAAQVLRKTHRSLGPTRSNLIEKGLLYAPEHGVIAFTVPGMSGFIGRQVTG